MTASSVKAMTLPRGVWLIAGTPAAAPYPCRCIEHGRRFCGSRGWPDGPGPWGVGCPCWGRRDWHLFVGCCGRWFVPKT